MKIPIAKTATKILNTSNKMFQQVNKGLFHGNAKVTKKTGTGAAKLLNKIGKLTNAIKLDGGAIQYTLKGAGKGLVVITGTGGKVIKSGGDAIGAAVGGVKKLGVTLITTTAGATNKLTRGVIDLRGGRKSRRKRRSRRRKSRRGRKSRRKSKKSRRKRRRTRRRRR